MKYKILYFLGKLIDKLTKKNYFLNYFFKTQGIKLGKNVRIYSNIFSDECFLIEIGDNSTISSDVKLITHDSSIGKVYLNKTDLFGKITIGKNCFIGANTIILCGVNIPNNTIIAAGTVITKSIINEREVWGGNPARKISSFEIMQNKYKSKAHNLLEILVNKKDILNKEENLVKR